MTRPSSASRSSPRDVCAGVLRRADLAVCREREPSSDSRGVSAEATANWGLRPRAHASAVVAEAAVARPAPMHGKGKRAARHSSRGVPACCRCPCCRVGRRGVARVRRVGSVAGAERVQQLARDVPGLGRLIKDARLALPLVSLAARDGSELNAGVHAHAVRAGDLGPSDGSPIGPCAPIGRMKDAHRTRRNHPNTATQPGLPPGVPRAPAELKPRREGQATATPRRSRTARAIEAPSWR
jgi:hypothetical protein